MKKKLLLGIGIPASVFLLIWLICFTAFSVYIIDEVPYNKHKLDRLSRQRNTLHTELVSKTNEKLQAVFDFYANKIIFDTLNRTDLPDDYTSELIGLFSGIIDDYYFDTRTIDSLFYNIDSFRTTISFPLQYVRHREFADIFPLKITLIEYENTYYDSNFLDFLRNKIELLRYDFIEKTNSQIGTIINNIFLNYNIIIENYTSTEEFIIYSNILSDYLDRMGNAADVSEVFFNYLLSEGIRHDGQNLHANIQHQPIHGFSPILLDVYEFNGVYFHAESLKKMNAILNVIAYDWPRYNREIINKLILSKTTEIVNTLNNTNEYFSPGFPEITGTIGYRFYSDMVHGLFNDFYINQNIVSGRAINIIENDTDINIQAPVLPVSAIKIDEQYYDANAVNVLNNSMQITSQAVLNKTQVILTDGIHQQTEIFLINIDEYINWYTSVFTGIDRTIAGIAGLFSGERSVEERFYTENFNRIMYKNTEIDSIIESDLNIINRIIAGLYNEYLELLYYFSVNPVQDNIENITKNDYISLFINDVAAYYEIVFDALDEANFFFYQDYTTNNPAVIRSLIPQQDSEMRHQITSRLSENQDNKFEIIGNPFDFFINRIEIGSLLFVDNFFAIVRTYRHYGVYIGNGTVVHYAPVEGQEISFENGIIHETTLENFLDGRALKIDRNAGKMFSDEEIVQRALSRLGEKEYDLLNNNCEHFARWCVTGNNISYQVENLPQRLSDALIFLNDNTNVISRFIDRFL